MSSPLEGCWAKIERANHHIDSLKTEIANFFRLNPHKVVGQFNADFTEYVYTATGPVTPSLIISIIAGEAISQLRSSLDHLVWALARNPRDNWRIAFPICTTVESYRKACRTGMIKGIAGTAQTIIQNAQPYAAGKPFDHPLTILHELNNTDKHKLLLVVYGSTVIPQSLSFSGEAIEHDEIELPYHWSNQLIRTVDGSTEVLRIRFTRPVPKMEVEGEFAPEIAFEKFGSAKIQPVIPGLVHLRDAVTKTIKLFTGEFSTGRASG